MSSKIVIHIHFNNVLNRHIMSTYNTFIFACNCFALDFPTSTFLFRILLISSCANNVLVNYNLNEFFRNEYCTQHITPLLA